MRSLRRLRIFVVNGDPDMNAVWREIFERAAEMFEVIGGGSFRTVEEAIAALRKIDPPPDLVLTNLRFSSDDWRACDLSNYDIAMEKGLDFVEEAKGISPVFVVSGAGDSWLERARKAGASWVGHPPLTITDIAEMVFCQYRAFVKLSLRIFSLGKD